MDEKRIKHFLTLADQLNFSKAADLLNITQPALSRSIQSMEAEIGISLFDRTTNKIRLTPAGLFLVGELQNLRERYSNMISQATSLQNGYSGQIKIGVTNGQSLYGVSQLLKKFQELYPNIRVFLISENLKTLRSMLDNHSLDLAVGMLGDFKYASHFSFQVIRRVPLRIVVSKDHPLACREGEPLHLSDFQNDSFILIPESETPSVHDIVRRCNKVGFWPKIIEVPDLLSVILWIEAGCGIAALAETSIAYGNPALRFLSLPELPKPELVFVWSDDDDKPVRRTFINYLKESISEEEQQNV